MIKFKFLACQKNCLICHLGLSCNRFATLAERTVSLHYKKFLKIVTINLYINDVYTNINNSALIDGKTELRRQTP